jgi:hypothetical protein
VVLDATTTAKAGANLSTYFITIQSLKISNLTLLSSSYGYSFYGGDVVVGSSMNKNILSNNNLMPVKTAGQVQFLVNSAGTVVSCATKGLQDSAIYLAAKSAAVPPAAVAAAAAATGATPAVAAAVTAALAAGVTPVVTAACDPACVANLVASIFFCLKINSSLNQFT